MLIFHGLCCHLLRIQKFFHLLCELWSYKLYPLAIDVVLIPHTIKQWWRWVGRFYYEKKVCCNIFMVEKMCCMERMEKRTQGPFKLLICSWKLNRLSRSACSSKKLPPLSLKTLLLSFSLWGQNHMLFSPSAVISTKETWKWTVLT